MDPGDRVSIEKDGLGYEGVLMPPRKGHIVIKMDNGYKLAYEIRVKDRAGREGTQDQAANKTP